MQANVQGITVCLWNLNREKHNITWHNIPYKKKLKIKCATPLLLEQKMPKIISQMKCLSSWSAKILFPQTLLSKQKCLQSAYTYMHIYRAHHSQGCGLRLTVNGWNGVAKSDHKGESSLEKDCCLQQWLISLTTWTQVTLIMTSTEVVKNLSQFYQQQYFSRLTLRGWSCHIIKSLLPYDPI